MADTLHFSLVSPARELFSGDVEQVDLPGTEGELGILPDHAPLMTAIRTGTITVYNTGGTTRYFVQGGFADVTPAGLTVLAERAVPEGEVDRAALEADFAMAQKSLESLDGDDAVAARQNLDGLRAAITTVGSN